MIHRNRLCLVLALVVAPAAFADESELYGTETRWSSKKPLGERSVGLGVSSGGGFLVSSNPTRGLFTPYSAITPAILLPTFELRVFSGANSFDLSVQVLNSLIVSIASRAFAFGLDAFYTVNIGEDAVRGLVGPGIGFGVITNGFLTGLDFRAQLHGGVEFLSEGRGFGFSILGKPYFDLALLTGGGYVAVGFGGGLILSVAFNGYLTR